MQHTPRLHKVKNRNNQVVTPYNTGVHFLTTPNDTQPARTQPNQKYFNNIGKMNEVSVLQYHRIPNFQMKNCTQGERYLPNRRHQQPILFKVPHHQDHLQLNYQQKVQLNKPSFKKIFKDKQSLNPAYISNINNFNTDQVKEVNSEVCVSRLYNEQNLKLRKDLSDAPDIKNEYVGKESQNNLKTNGSKEKFIKECSKESNNEDNNKFEKHIKPELKINNTDSDVIHFEEGNEKFANGSREKTPMCLINDLARFNKISFQYRLTSENGPAHCKRFTVTLKLGDEEYTAEGLKIKKAQHLAAKEAISKTKYKHPIPKTSRNDDSTIKTNITPTVELNALAMKLGQQTYYIFDPIQMNTPQRTTVQNNSLKNNLRYNVKPCETTDSNQPTTTYMIDNLSKTFASNLTHNEGKQIFPLTQKPSFFSSKNVSPLQYSVKSACKVNSLVSTYFPSTSPCKITLIVGTRKFEGVGRTLQQAKHNAASNALQVLKEHINNEQKNEQQNESTEVNENKSPISLVFEIGIKRNLHVDFKVLREEGPAHMRTFVTACIVGDLMTEGEGTGKKISKKRAAQKMLEKLSKLPPMTTNASPVKKVKMKITSNKSESGQSKKTLSVPNTTKEETDRQRDKNKTKNGESDSNNPITKLLEWHQNRKEKEPIFKLINEGTNENSRRRQFVMEVSSNNIIARGVGPNKKLAKRDAAQNFLTAVSERGDIRDTSNDNCKRKISTENNVVDIQRQDEVCNSMESRGTYQEQTGEKENATNSLQVPQDKESDPSSVNRLYSKNINLHMKDQLMYLAKLLGFEVEFSDYPKGNHNEFLSIVMLSTNPPQICHGVGTDPKESQEDAARNALRILSEMGLNNAVKS